MKIGYPCINRSVGCTPNTTFRLASYSPEKMKEKVRNNLDCLEKTIRFNIDNNLLFFRIGSPLIPFASHPVCKFKWQEHFKEDFCRIGELIKNNKMRISMHPDQFTLINSKKNDIFKRSVKELVYHEQVLNLLGLNKTHKIQIHVGGVYGEKEKSIERFINRYRDLPINVKERLVIENDENSYSLKDCLFISKKTKVPVLLDVFHHSLKNNGESIAESFEEVKKTWKKKDGIPMIDYSSQEKGKRRGSHTEKINLNHFKNFMKKVEKFDFDLMFEIKDKEKSALKAIKFLSLNN
jgi:UV DNA damage endonuclease